VPCIVYIPRRFSGSSAELIDRANAIIAEYSAQGFSLTLRQLYYQFVARGIIPNKQTEYKRLGSVINDARLAGKIDWNAIEDRTRNLQDQPHWDSPEELIEAAAEQYRTDKWNGQTHRIEVWIEKDALTGVIEPICRELDIPYFACRGYSSQSEQWSAGQRFIRHIRRGVTPVLLHLGDHDPSGVDMTRDNRDRLCMFVEHHTGQSIVVERLALNMDQVQEHNPPPNPAKLTDSRSTDYIDKFGDESWELDALDPPIIAGLIRDAVLKYRHEVLWDAAVAEENRQRGLMDQLKANWDSVAEALERGDFD
jgi:hypothetical protein